MPAKKKWTPKPYTEEEKEARAEKVKSKIAELKTKIEAANGSPEMLTYLASAARFHRYSFLNAMWIYAQKPDAGRVAGYTTWQQKFKRTVKKGEHGIQVLAPIIITKDKDTPDERTALIGFKIAYIFDESQTEGEPLPPLPNWKSLEMLPVIQEALLKLCAAEGITVTVTDAITAQGTSAIRSKEIQIRPDAGTKTLVHEIAHQLLNATPEDNNELNAESAAYIVMAYLGHEAEGSANYITLHGNDAAALAKNAEKIQKIARRIIDSLEAAAPEVLQAIPPEAAPIVPAQALEIETETPEEAAENPRTGINITTIMKRQRIEKQKAAAAAQQPQLATA